MLLEVIVAFTILVIAGASAVAAATEAAHAVARARETEARLREASAFLDAVALWTRDDLDLRLGERPQGRWRLHIGRIAPTLYIAVLSDSGATGRELLRTSLYRAATAANAGASPGSTAESVPQGDHDATP